ncbi:MAG: polymerase sigma-70 factor, subfamily [Thermoleophilaceae bacterium]|jgi:RNA polymerase sigma-70 factor (ECF subfamily)|nr:polymerase sigma-70 factor, subfamily [Thermoleophilaceae bacterium]
MATLPKTGPNHRDPRRVSHHWEMSAAMLKTLQTEETEDSMRALYRTYGSELYGFAVSCLGDRGQAEELVQEVFTRVWRHAGSFDPDKASFRTWLYGIARNAIIDLKRRQAVRPALAQNPETEDQGAVDDSFERALLRWQVGAALDRLTPEHRQVIRLAHFQGLTLREISERTGIPLGTVKSRTSYALRGLRLALEEMGVEA